MEDNAITSFINKKGSKGLLGRDGSKGAGGDKGSKGRKVKKKFTKIILKNGTNLRQSTHNKGDTGFPGAIGRTGFPGKKVYR